METQGFYSRDDDFTLRKMKTIFLGDPKYVYFIEDKVTKKWFTLAVVGWTNDPNEALSFPTYPKAFIAAKRLELKNFYITEHEFVD